MARAEIKAIRTGAGRRAKNQAVEKAQEEAQAQPRVKITVLMPADVARELKVAWQRVPKNEFESITSLLTDAAVAAIQRFRDQYNDGKPFVSTVPPRMPRGRRPQE